MEAWRTPTGKVARKMYSSQEGEGGGGEGGNEGRIFLFPPPNIHSNQRAVGPSASVCQ